jgi:dihydrofolate reductase
MPQATQIPETPVHLGRQSASPRPMTPPDPLPPILVAAADRGGAIGRAGALPWRIPAELRHFRARTAGHALVIGRTTFDRLPRPLDTHGRALVVVSTQPLEPTPGRALHHASSPEDALALAGRLRPGRPPLVCGGARLYAALLEVCATLEISRIDQETEDADAFLPEIAPPGRMTEAGPWQDGPPRWRLERWAR